jgi:hypothetical protein
VSYQLIDWDAIEDNLHNFMFFWRVIAVLTANTLANRAWIEHGVVLQAAFRQSD